MKAKKVSFCGLLTALAIVLSLAERLFPLDAVVPVPGVKLGLANVVTLFALTRLSVRDAFFILVCRVTISSVLMGSVTAFLSFLLVMSVPLGLVTGLTCSVVLAHMKKIEFHV